MEDQISRTIEDSIKVVKDTWSKDLAEIRSMLCELVGNLPTSIVVPIVQVEQYIIINSSLLQNYEEKSKRKRKMNVQKVFDKRLTNYCPIVYAETESDTPIEMAGEEAKEY
ncbi:hypothetical protein KY290_021660 [Solanum tuberosum]|uniref:Uncharacterized protein n=1 Tax=Solanum tuberosum TaxID=4113 RepID=A0ABQ7V486_SOLTU|nr:hypothetical protein KY289_020825 [Solanum tuberosum]KAH0758167.1 hypothetical protein KY290_021660 [Solanum tuberosum]